MAEQLDLTTPDQAEPGTPVYRVAGIWLDWDGRNFYVVLIGDNGTQRQETYRDNEDASGDLLEGSTIATDRMRTLNKANLSNKSLQKRIMEMLINDGRLEGSISGTPD
jgi:hypothetical protein